MEGWDEGSEMVDVMMMKMADEVIKEVMNLDNMVICVCHNVIIHGLSARKAENTIRVLALEGPYISSQISMNVLTAVT